jgi:hypothetical protein
MIDFEKNWATFMVALFFTEESIEKKNLEGKSM